MAGKNGQYGMFLAGKSMPLAGNHRESEKITSAKMIKICWKNRELKEKNINMKCCSVNELMK